MGPWQELRRVPDDELNERLSAAMQQVGITPGVDHYLGEIRHRQIERHTARVKDLTWVIAGLTLVNGVLVAATLLD